jgi:hypothetical protein
VDESYNFSLQDFDLGKKSFSIICDNMAYFLNYKKYNCTGTVGKPLAKGCSAVVYAAKLKKAAEDEGKERESERKSMKVDFPFAIKMMFNYHAESNALTILRAMQR